MTGYLHAVINEQLADLARFGSRQDIIAAYDDLTRWRTDEPEAHDGWARDVAAGHTFH